MNAHELRSRLYHVLGTGSGVPSARAMLLEVGAGMLGVEPAPDLMLETLLRLAVVAPAGEARRAFGVLLVHALRVPGLVRPAARRTPLDEAICAFLEMALLNALRRAGYPFGASLYDRLSFLEALHASIDEHMRPLEASIPAWLHGMRREGTE